MVDPMINIMLPGFIIKVARKGALKLASLCNCNTDLFFMRDEKNA
jgi:hypothetical protein